jgi:hypothetical protein
LMMARCAFICLPPEWLLPVSHPLISPSEIRKKSSPQAGSASLGQPTRAFRQGSHPAGREGIWRCGCFS